MAVASTRDRLSVVVNKRPNVIVNQSNITVKRLGDLTDVDTSDKKDGSLLIYDDVEKKFVTTNILDKQEVNGGFF
jgi:hypothetical protein